MTVTVAEHAGFCFGVKRAVEGVFALTERAARSSEKIYSLGKLIHNPHLIEELEQKGVQIIDPDEIDSIYAEADSEHKCVIVIRAHGVEKQVSDKLLKYSEANENFKVCDLTCPYVKKIHSIAAGHNNCRFVIAGDRNHPEVKGIYSYAGSDTVVCGNADEVAALEKSDKPTVIAAQTTFDISEWKKCQENIKKVCTNPIIFDTICSVTETRQREADEMSKNCDIMFVVGGKESSNTNKLYRTAKRNLERTYLIESADDIPKIKLSSLLRVGITAGASTPGGIIEEVKNKMAEIENTTAQTEKGENFAELLEDSLKTLNTGETIRGTITSISANELHVDLGTKVTGIIPASEVSDDPSIKLDEMFKVGDEITAMVGKVSDRDGVAMLSKKRVDSIQKWQEILNAFNDGAILEGKVIEAVKGGVVMLCGANRIFVPASQSGLPKDADLQVLVGQTKKVKIIDVNEGRKRAVASIKAVEREEKRAREAAFWDAIEVGQEFEGAVKSLTSYGAFVDLGGVDGMVHSSELSWRHIKHPSEVVSVGDVIKVHVKSVDKEAKRISLGYKTEDMIPWNVFKAKYQLGDVADVKIVSLVDFGAFAEVVPGADGLIHISQIADHKIDKPGDVLKVGDIVKVKIIDIDEENRKISLSIRALLEDAAPEVEAEDAAEEN